MWTEDTVNTAGEICLPVKAGDQPAYPIWLEESFEKFAEADGTAGHTETAALPGNRQQRNDPLWQRGGRTAAAALQGHICLRDTGRRSS